MSVRKFFNEILNDYKQSQAAKRLAKASIKAIDGEWDDSHTTDIKKLKDLGLHGEAAYRDILSYAVKKAPMDVFSAVYDVKDDPNCRVYVAGGVPVGSRWSEAKTLLYMAIDSDREDIARFLAEDSRTDITISGFRSVHNERENTVSAYPLPLDHARAKNMDDVVAILSEPSAALRVQKAATL